MYSLDNGLGWNEFRNQTNKEVLFENVVAGSYTVIYKIINGTHNNSNENEFNTIISNPYSISCGAAEPT